MTPSWTDIGVFWIAMLSVLVAGMATALSWWLYRAQTTPEVVVYVIADVRRPSLINLVIENIGKAVAKNIRFDLSDPLPAKAFGFDNPPPAQQMTTGPLISGIPALGPGAKRVITWGQYGGLHAALGQRVVTVTAHYSVDRRTPWDGDELITESLIDVKSLEGTDISDHNYDKVAAEQLKTIASAVEKLNSSWRALRIEVVNQQSQNAASDDAAAAR